MKLKQLLIIVLCFTYSAKIVSKVPLSRALICVKNKDSMPLALKTSVGNPSKTAQLSPGQIATYFINPYYFFTNIQEDMIYLHFRPKLGAADWITLTTNPPSVYGTYDNREQFMKTVGNRLELYLCSITTTNPTNAATCTIHSNFAFNPKDTPDQVCQKSLYP